MQSSNLTSVEESFEKNQVIGSKSKSIQIKLAEWNLPIWTRRMSFPQNINTLTTKQPSCLHMIKHSKQTRIDRRYKVYVVCWKKCKQDTKIVI